MQTIAAEIYPDAVKMKKQMSYANAKQIPFVALVGESEMAEGKVNIKNMTTGEQMLVDADQILDCIQ